ncbi:MAG: energy-coupling factor transporter transmembrane component T [archaeon]|nr:energy-coupling factor transporter transmembrane component T [archaeon]
MEHGIQVLEIAAFFNDDLFTGVFIFQGICDKVISRGYDDSPDLRAFEISFSFMHPVKSVQNFIPIIIPVLMLLLKRSHELSLSIDSRAFRANKKMTYPKKLRFGLEDCLFLLFVAVVCWIMLV